MLRTVNDKLAFQFQKVSKRTYTDEGYLKVPGRAARTGIQKYLAIELGIKDRNPLDEVSVYRPEGEVFNADSLASYQDKDVTNDHPASLVDKESFKKVSVGHVSGLGTKDGDYVIVDMIIKDKDAIKDVENGKVELSAGYTAEYAHEPGITKDGEPYEYVQRNIVINHVALVDRARAGKDATLFDKSPENLQMITVSLDASTTVEVADKATAQLINQTIDSLRVEAKDANSALVKAEQASAKLEATNDSLKEENEKLKEQTADSAIEQRVNDRVQLCDSARQVITGYDSAGKSDAQIKLDVCKASYPKRSFDGKSEAYIEASFDQAMEEVKEKKDEDEKEKKEATDSLNGFAQDAASIPVADSQKQRDNARQAYMDRLAGKETK